MRKIIFLIILLIDFSKQINPPVGTSSIKFVFDVTGSMHDDLLQVIQGATHIYNVTLRREYSIYNYILIPFGDPHVGLILKTRDSKLFQRGLQDLIVQGGGDCPGMTITAIKLVLEQSLPDSFIYVFTDARSKDYLLSDTVLKLIQEKQSQVVFVMIGDCGDQDHIGYQIFHKIAATSSGQVFTLDRKQVSEQTRKVNLLVIDKIKRNKQTYILHVDSKLLEFTISVSGANPQVTLIDPSSTSTYLTIEISNKDDIQNAQQTELIDLYGNILVNQKLQLNTNNSLLYSTIEKFQPPVKNFFFYIRLTGIDNNVNVDYNSIQIKSNQLYNIQCYMQSQLPYYVQWFKNAQLISQNDYPSHLTTVKYLIKLTEINAEGLYICNVTSTSGYDIDEINVDILAPPPIIQILPTKELFTLINITISIKCLVQSTKDYNLIWKQELPSSSLSTGNALTHFSPFAF
ncbi:unnamed protein product [Rotaria sp. Silwood2]|nr:unnamed protein product [Rotaria sp. Silwood2]